MPGFDGTGPAGMGPMTGGGRGFCSPWGSRGGFGRGFGRGLGRGFGRGYGSGRWAPYPYADPWAGYGAGYQPGTRPAYAPQMSREEELEFLKNEARGVKGQLDEIDARIRELEAEE